MPGENILKKRRRKIILVYNLSPFLLRYFLFLSRLLWANNIHGKEEKEKNSQTDSQNKKTKKQLFFFLSFGLSGDYIELRMHTPIYTGPPSLAVGSWRPPHENLSISLAQNDCTFKTDEKTRHTAKIKIKIYNLNSSIALFVEGFLKNLHSANTIRRFRPIAK